MKWYFNPFKRDKAATERARKEVVEARKELERVEELSSEAKAIGNKMRIMRQENHFAERLHRTMGGITL